MATQQAVELFEKLGEVLEGLVCQLDEALTTSRRLSRVFDRIVEQAHEQVDEVNQWDD